VFCNSIVTVIKLYAFVGLNCNNWIIMHGMETVNKVHIYFRPDNAKEKNYIVFDLEKLTGMT
jgi:hypothetical protein